MNSVWLLWHTHVLEGEEDSKLLGVYSTQTKALAAQDRISNQPGFREHPEGFELVEYELDRDHWTEGFVTVRT